MWFFYQNALRCNFIDLSTDAFLPSLSWTEVAHMVYEVYVVRESLTSGEFFFRFRSDVCVSTVAFIGVITSCSVEVDQPSSSLKCSVQRFRRRWLINTLAHGSCRSVILNTRWSLQLSAVAKLACISWRLSIPHCFKEFQRSLVNDASRVYAPSCMWHPREMIHEDLTDVMDIHRLGCLCDLDECVASCAACEGSSAYSQCLPGSWRVGCVDDHVDTSDSSRSRSLWSRSCCAEWMAFPIVQRQTWAEKRKHSQNSDQRPRMWLRLTENLSAIYATRKNGTVGKWVY